MVDSPFKRLLQYSVWKMVHGHDEKEIIDEEEKKDTKQVSKVSRKRKSRGGGERERE